MNKLKKCQKFPQFKYPYLLIFILFLVFTSCVEQKTFDPRAGLKGFDAGEYPNKNITDGPYVFYNNQDIIVKWIEKNEVVEYSITDDNWGVIKKNFGFELKPEWIRQSNNPIDYKQEFNNVDRFVALSDIHGQYKVFVKLLREYKVIDQKNNWNFGTNHLVIVGDIFDRGDQVNEILWLVYKLEHQAIEQGGKLHYLLGNHEVMMFKRDFRYVNEKYVASAQKLNTSYDQLYSENTVLGRWLRTKPVIVQINDVLFVHAGISPELIQKNVLPEQINKMFLTDILGKSDLELKRDSLLEFMEDSNGPVWYRGYFNDENLNRTQINQILKYFNKKHIVVGHTSQESIVSLFGNRVFGIDSNIKNGKYGEVLIYDKGNFFRGTIKMSVPY